MKMIDPMDFAHDPLLKNIQGNILKGHGRDHSTNIFLHFDKGKENTVKKWLAKFGREQVTSFKKQLKEREVFKRNKISGGLFASCFLSLSGYTYLGFSDAEDKFNDPAFKAGMKQRRVVLNDPDESKWEKPFRDEFHAMILLADDDTTRMSDSAREILKELDKFSKVCTIEYGEAIRNANGDGLEHFGYVDGISQPLFLKDEVDSYFSFHGISKDAGNLKFDPTADTDLVLVSDPYAMDSEKSSSFGSYFVFRKLEQDVRSFKETEERLDLGELGGAYVVGRFEDGSTVVLTDDEGAIGSGNFNNFDYSSDPSGGRCPHFAHIRKTNPRSDLAGDHKSHIMARRGIPFGKRHIDPSIEQHSLQQPTGGVGLLFMSFQASLINQFEFIQQKWANNLDFAERNTGIDPIIGMLGDGSEKRNYRFPDEYGGSPGEPPKSFNQFVHMRGGEYFFAPSISFFSRLEKQFR